MDIIKFLVQNVLVFVLNCIWICFVTLFQKNLSMMQASNLEVSLGSNIFSSGANVKKV